MPEAGLGPEALRERVVAHSGAEAAGAMRRLDAVLDLVEAGAARRGSGAGAGLNQAAAELLVADALLTVVAANPAEPPDDARAGDAPAVGVDTIDFAALAERARRIDERSRAEERP